MKHDTSQVIRWLRIARDYTGDLPEFDDPENTVKGILAHLDAAIAALEAEPLAEGYLYDLGYKSDRLTWGRFSTAEPYDEKDVCLRVTIHERKPDA